jgi:nitrate/nitrite transporter NarK
MNIEQRFAPEPYPVQYSVDYPDRPLNRLTTFFRLLVAIPILIVIGLVESGGFGYSGGRAWTVGGAGLVVVPTLLLILLRQKYPRWSFDWNIELMRFSARVGVYLALMEDRYPSTDEHQAVHLEFPYPDAHNDLNRWLPLVKWLLAIPHYVVLLFLYIAAFFVVIAAWFAILFTGRFPRSMFDFLVGVGRWTNRVVAYAHVLVTDRYPPFRLAP